MSRPQNTALDLVTQFLGRQNVIPIHTPFVRLLGDYTAAAFLAQVLYWGDRTSDAHGWFHKSHEEWQEELLLTPDQVRRCIRTCGDMVQVKRAGIPARNYFRPNQDAIATALEGLANDNQNPTTRNGQTQHLEMDKPHDKPQTNPTTVGGETPRQVVRRTQHLITEPTSEPTQNPQQKKNTLATGVAASEPGQELEHQPHAPQTFTGSVNVEATAQPSEATGLEQVPPAAPGAVDNPMDKRPAVRQTDFARLVGVWNEHRGPLPAVEDITEGRKKSIRKLLTDCGGNVDKAAHVLADATREVAADPFWQERRYGLDTLVPGKVMARAEAWRARQTPVQTAPSAATLPSTRGFQVGQLVTYKRDRYTVDAVTDTYIELYDDTNGSLRVTLASSDFTAIRPLEQRSA